MHENENRQPSQELEVTVSAGKMHLRINGSSTYVSMPFDVSEQKLQELKRHYFQLDELARRHENKERDYKKQEAALSAELGKILFAQQPDVSPDRQLAVILDACLGALREGEYMRLLLSFEEPCQGDLPWELASWTHRGQDVCFGRDRRIALSRLEHGRAGIRRRNAFGRDGVLSILHVGADAPDPARRAATDTGKTEYETTRDFFRLVDERIPRLHVASRSSAELEHYWIDGAEITGQPPEVDIVHWDSHGSMGSLGKRTPSGDYISIFAADLFERTQNAFLYVVRACEAGGALPLQSCQERRAYPPSLSTALLDAGAPAVLGTHDVVAPQELAYLPILYPLLFQGWPLDYCVQYMRRFFAMRNADHPTEPYDRWYKLILRATSVWYLDGTPALNSHVSGRDPILTVAALCRHFDRLSVDRATRQSAYQPPAGLRPVLDAGQAAQNDDAAPETATAVPAKPGMHLLLQNPTEGIFDVVPGGVAPTSVSHGKAIRKRVGGRRGETRKRESEQQGR